MTGFGFTGDLLIRKGVADANGVARAIAAQSAHPMTLGRALSKLGLADESLVAATIALALHLEHLDGDPPFIGADVLALIPEDVRRKRGVVPLSFDGKVLRVAVADPMDESVLQDVRFRTDRHAVAVVVTETWLERVGIRTATPADVSKQYDMLARITPAGEVETANENEYDLVDPATLAKDVLLPPIVRLVNLILSDAATAGASDVHIEPQETTVQVRQRVDGLLRDVLTIPLHLRDQTISRMKIMSGMDIAERRKPQDGRSRLRFAGRRIDLRVSTLPTQFGEKVVIRLLNSERAIQALDQIGFSTPNVKLMQSFLAHPQGMILVTGPTGSG